MGKLEDKVYLPECIQSNLPLDDYFNKDKTFGKFIENGAAYVIENQDTPRPWLQFLCNDTVYSCVSNRGKGYLHHIKGWNITKQWEASYYYTHEPCGERKIFIEENGVKKEFFDDAEDLKVTVRPGSVLFEGHVGDLKMKVSLFVPEKLPCECWNIEIKNVGTSKSIDLTVMQDWYFRFSDKGDGEPLQICYGRNEIVASKTGMTGVFAINGDGVITSTNVCQEVRTDGKPAEITKVALKQTLRIDSNATVVRYVVSGACDDDEDITKMLPQILACIDGEQNSAELRVLQSMWGRILRNNLCVLPDKNAEYFLNYWLKNQLYMTYRYDRGSRYVGYRDGLQDSWGYLLVDPHKAKEKLLTTLSYMMPDGRCPRQYYKWGGHSHDMRDFSDSVIWAADALTGYIKETGDFAILDEILPFLNSDEVSEVEDHVFRGLDSLYQLRGKNGLIRMRDGDWFDGLGGINKYGDDATSVWVTIAAFYAQNTMAELYERIGNVEKANLMKQRSLEYQTIVNEVGWDGNWFTYGFFEDGEPIGASENLEGKIYLNSQTWAIFSGITEDKAKICRMEKAINRYLQTPFGPLLQYPPYVLYGERCGRVQRQRPGTYGNGAIYNHAATFKIYSDVARGDYDDALDTFQRVLPNHPDNSDMCRTGEPYAVGNVYYGPNNSRFGMNLFTWFTATPAWAIHGGFEQILGVKADYDGLLIQPHICADWKTYSVDKIYRDTLYHISFERTDEEKGVWLDGVKQAGNLIKSDRCECSVVVKF